MRTAECMDLLNEVEATFPVADWRIADVRIWPIVRQQIAWYSDSTWDQYRSDSGVDRPTRRRLAQAGDRLANLARFVRASLRDAHHTASLRRHADVVVLGDNVSRIKVGDTWYDRLCEPIIEALAELGLSALHLEPHHVYRTPRHDRARFIQPAIDARWLRSRGPLPDSVRDAPLEGYADLLQLLERRGLRRGGLDEATLRRNVRYILLLAGYFERVLARVGAGSGVLVDYSFIQMGFNHACWRRGLPSIELQHGVEGDLHWAYSRWSNVPSEGYSLLPSVFWTWGEAEAAVIDRWARGTSRHRAVAGGNPWLERWRSGDAALAASLDDEARSVVEWAGIHDCVLVTLQWGQTGSDEIVTFRRVMELLPSSWNWCVRLHPAMTKEDLRRVRAVFGGGTSNVRLHSAADVPLYALLPEVDAHLTSTSAVVIEAQEFGVPSVSADPAAIELFPQQVAAGWLAAVGSPEEAAAALESQRARGVELRASAGAPTASPPASVLRSIVGRR